MAKVVATDQTRMLTLLKIDGEPACRCRRRCPRTRSRSARRPSPWAGRSPERHDEPPSVSVGIISAVGRIWGKAIQTDAKMSPINYGGPLVDLQGRVQGILVPASPHGRGRDGRLRVVRLGHRLRHPAGGRQRRPAAAQAEPKGSSRGLLGVNMKSAATSTAPRRSIGSVAPGSAAEKAGLKPGDSHRRDRRQAGRHRPRCCTSSARNTRATRSRVKVHARRRGDRRSRRGARQRAGGVRPALPGHPADARRSGARRRGPLRLSQESGGRRPASRPATASSRSAARAARPAAPAAADHRPRPASST